MYKTEPGDYFDNMKDKIITPPEINAEFKKNGIDSSELVISDEQYAQLSEVTNAEQIAKLKCWDIQEYIDSAEAQKIQIEAQKSQIDAALSNAQTQLEEAKSNLIQTRTDLKSIFDTIFGPLGLENKMISVSQSSPHVVTVIDSTENSTQPVGE